LVASPAAAQVGAVVSIFSDDRFRGYSLSDGRPVAILDLSYDAPSGVYGSVSGTIVAARGEGPQPLRLALNAGYARRLRSGLAADLGIVHSRYSRYSGLSSGRSYTEVYAGLSGRIVGARLSVSPNYLGPSRWTIHGEVNGHLDVTPKLLLDGEIGVLVHASGGYHGNSRAQIDARVGIARRVGPITLHAAVSARGSGPDIYAGREHSRAALILGGQKTRGKAEEEQDQ
jgi:uncharacterized protein (TIGR02001 family)